MPPGNSTSRLLQLLCVSWPFLVTGNLERRPFGPRMCKFLCQKTYGCSYEVFETTDLHLYCRINMTVSTEERKGLSVVCLFRGNKTKEQKHNKLSSEGGVSTERIKKERTSSFFLFSPKGSINYHRLYQLLQEDNKYTLRLYPYITAREVTAMAYISATRKLILSMGHPRSKTKPPMKIVSSTLYTRESDILAHDGVEKFAVDQPRQLVFVLTYRSNFVGRLDTNQNQHNYASIIRIFKRDRLVSISLDTRKETVYALSFREIITFNYRGGHCRFVLQTDLTSALVVHPTEGYLYFNKHYKLLKKSLINDTLETYVSLVFTPTELQVFTQNLFVTNFREICKVVTIFCEELDFAWKESLYKIFTMIH